MGIVDGNIGESWGDTADWKQDMTKTQYNLIYRVVMSRLLQEAAGVHQMLAAFFRAPTGGEL